MFKIFAIQIIRSAQVERLDQRVVIQEHDTGTFDVFCISFHSTTHDEQLHEIVPYAMQLSILQSTCGMRPMLSEHQLSFFHATTRL